MLHSMWDLPGPGLEPVSPALAGGFLTTAPPGKSSYSISAGRLAMFLSLPINLFIIGCLHCCARVFSSCGEQGLLLAVVCGLLIVVASLVVEHRL